MQRLWDAIKDIGGIFWPARFSIAVVIIAVPFLFLLGPSQDALLAAVGQGHSVSSKVALAAVCLLWALETFYWAYFMSRLPPAPKGERADPEHAWLLPARLEALNNAFPFWLGLAALLIAAGATVKANWGNDSSLALIAAAGAVDVAIYVLVTRRFGADQLTPLIRFLLIVPGMHGVAPLVALQQAHGHHQHRDLFQAPAQADGPPPAAPPGPPPPAPPPGPPPPMPPPGPPPARRFADFLALRWRIALLLMIAATLAVYLGFGPAALATRQAIGAAVSLDWLIVAGACVMALNPNDMQRLTKFWVLFNFALFTAIFIASLYAAPFLNGWFPSLVSSPLVLLSAFCAWVFFGTFFFALPAELFRLPVTAAVLLLALAVSAIPGDNHDLRRADSAVRPPVLLAAAFEQWHNAAKREWKGPGPVPLIIVATAGGASRAGYWTAKVLGELEDAYPNFHRYVFAVSSVSGGTVGAGLWRAMLQHPPLCQRQGHPEMGGNYVNCARLFFCQDFLGPLFLNGLYADLTQRILPGRLLPDRATALEQSWEIAWDNMMRDPDAAHPAHPPPNPMSAAFHDLTWTDDDWRPLLLINGTSEKSGRRIITSQLAIDRGQFPDAIGFFDQVKAELNLSTALHNSARFTYLDAAGNIVLAPDDPKTPSEQGVRADRILDGGYFENFGADTAFDLLQAIRALPVAADKQFQPIMLQISANPELEADDQRDKDWRLPFSVWPPDPTLTVAADVLAPLTTLFSTRDAHGIRATELSENSVGDPAYAHFRLTNGDITMSWAMSGWLLKYIDEEWEKPKPPNQAAKETLAGIFGPPPTTVSRTPDPPCGGL